MCLRGFESEKVTVSCFHSTLTPLRPSSCLLRFIYFLDLTSHRSATIDLGIIVPGSIWLQGGSNGLRGSRESQQEFFPSAISSERRIINIWDVYETPHVVVGIFFGNTLGIFGS